MFTSVFITILSQGKKSQQAGPSKLMSLIRVPYLRVKHACRTTSRTTMAREEAIPGHCRVNWPVRQTIITVYCGQRLRPMTSQKNPSLRTRQRKDIIRSQEESVEEDTRVIDVITDLPTPRKWTTN